MKKYKTLWLALIAVLAISLVWTGAALAAEPWLRARFMQVLVDLRVERDATILDDLTVGGDADITGTGAFTGNVAIGGAVDPLTALDVTGAAMVSGDLSVGDSVTTVGNVVVGDMLNVTAQTAITVTNGAVFTPTGTYQPIAAAGAVTPTIAMGAAGDLLTLVNTTAQAVLIEDTGTTNLTTDWTGNISDTLTLISTGTYWLEVSRADN